MFFQYAGRFDLSTSSLVCTPDLFSVQFLTVVVVDTILQTFDGKDGRKKYPRRWVIFPPLLWVRWRPLEYIKFSVREANWLLQSTSGFLLVNEGYHYPEKFIFSFGSGAPMYSLWNWRASHLYWLGCSLFTEPMCDYLFVCVTELSVQLLCRWLTYRSCCCKYLQIL